MKVLYAIVFLGFCVAASAQGIRIVPTYPDSPYRDWSRNSYVVDDTGVYVERFGDSEDSLFGLPESINDRYQMNLDDQDPYDEPYGYRRDIRIERY